MRDLEQIFTRQEQAVVYLFSRYWEQIPEFVNKTISRIHVHFPDFSIVNADGKVEAIEFEYDLYSFRSHLDDNCIRRLFRKDGVRRLYIVYWEHNDDEHTLRALISKKAKLDVKFVCLKTSFQAVVKHVRGAEGLETFWQFTKRKGIAPQRAYSRSSIMRDAKKLQPAVEFLRVDKKLYRVIGFNARGAEFIDCDHLEQIRFFTTTTRFSRDRIPTRLFMKSTGCKYFNGYFDIRAAFEIVKATKPVKKFLADYYFSKWAEDISDEKCFVGDFTRLDYDHGKKLYDLLKKNKFRLDIRGSITIENKDVVDRIDAIVRKNKNDDGRRRNR